MFKATLIAVDGPSGAGKTTLAGELAAAFSRAGLRVQVVQLDTLCGGWDDLAGGVGRARTLAQAFHAGLPLITPRYDWIAGSWQPPVVLPRPEVLIFDGCGAACDQIAAPWRVWCHAPGAIRAARVKQRDAYDWSEHWLPWQRQHAALRYRARRGYCAGALACQWRYFSADSSSLGAAWYAAKISTTITSVSVPVASSGGMTSNSLEPTR